MTAFFQVVTCSASLIINLLRLVTNLYKR